MNKKYILILLLGLVLIFSGFYYLSLNNESNIEIIEQENIITEEENNTNQEENNQSNTNTNTEKEDNGKTEGKVVLDPKDKKASCENYGGVWIEKKSICEINSYFENQCVATGGEFNPCASSCRHDEDAEICTLQCVLTCTFK